MVKKIAVVIVALFFVTSDVFSLDIPLTIQNQETSAKTSEPVTSGVPFAEGVITDTSNLRILNGSGGEMPAQFLVTARWPDNSIRWVLYDFQADLPASGTASFTLQTGSTPNPVTGITLTDQATTISVNTGTTTFIFNKNDLSIGGNDFTAQYNNQTYTAVPTAGTWQIEENGPLKAVVRIDGNWYQGGNILRDALIGFRTRLFFYRNKNYVRVSFTFKNNNSFGWDNGLNQQPDVTISGISAGVTSLLPGGGSYVFGSGVEKTFHLVFSESGPPTIFEVRYQGDGTVASGYNSTDRPLALALPTYYASTRAWGRIVPPLTGLPTEIQSDFDRYEKLQRAKVSSSDLENPVNNTGITAFQHLYQDVGSWNDYGDLRWNSDEEPWSSNHYDWIYGMYLQMMRTGNINFANLARVLARHEIDMDIYHTTNDGQAFNRQKNWELRPSHNNPNNSFGPGRPTHTWSQGYALHWLLTGDPRGKDAFEEILDGVRNYVYESFNEGGHCNTNEIRLQGWLTENLVNLWRIAPDTVWHTSTHGDKDIDQAIEDVLQNVFEREATAGGNGYVYAGDPDTPDPNTRHPLQNCYFIEPAAKAYEEVFAGRDANYATQLLGLIKRMTRYLMSVTYGGDTNTQGLYRPRQIPLYINPPEPLEGQIPYLLMAGNAAGFCYLYGGESDFLDYPPVAFQDYIRYFNVTAGDTYLDPSERSPSCYNTNIFVGTESKVQGWSSRYGMFLFAAMAETLLSECNSVTGFSLGSPCGTVGEPVTITVNGESGLYYKYWVNENSYCDGSNPNWLLLQNWTTNTTCTYTPSSTGLKTIVVWSTTDTNDPCTGMTGGSYSVETGAEACMNATGITLSTTCGQSGDPVTITVTSTDPGLQYKYWVNNNSYCTMPNNQNWQLLQNWTTSTTHPWTPAQPGLYTIVVWTASDTAEPCTGMIGIAYEVK